MLLNRHRVREGSNFVQKLSIESALSRNTNSAHWKKVDNRLQRPSYHRAWVIQEVGRAARARLVYGESTMDWDNFSRIIADILYDGTATELLSLKAQRASYHVAEMKRLGKKYFLNRKYTKHYHPKRLFELLISTQSSQSTDERDKVFSLLGISDDVKKDDLDGYWAPDYGPTNTSADVFKRFALWNIRANLTLETLSCTARGNTANIGIPSWVPIWTAQLDNEQPFVRYND